LIMSSFGAILFMIAKSIFGFIMNYFQTQKKLIFMNFLIALCKGTRNIICHHTRMQIFPITIIFGKEVVILPNTSCLINISNTLLCQKEFKDNYNCNVICDNFENNHCSDIGLGLIFDVWSQGKIYKTYTSEFLLVLVFTCIDLIFATYIKIVKCIYRHMYAFKIQIYCYIRYGKKFVAFFVAVRCNGKNVTNFFLHLIFSFLCFGKFMPSGYFCFLKLLFEIWTQKNLSNKIYHFFFLGKILEKLGYGYTFILFLAFYSLYANVISSSNVSVSIQGIISGVKDDLGYNNVIIFSCRSIDSLIESIFLKKFGGSLTLQIFSIFAAFCSLVYLLFYLTYLKHEISGNSLV
ncbi:hypothetical protein ALC53_06129, partial [Atta colombica]